MFVYLNPTNTMKKVLLSLTFAAASLIALAQPGRYRTEIFTSYDVHRDSIYAKNYSVLTGTPTLIDLKMDIYLPPASDTLSKRPLIIYLHTGNFLPKYVNQSPVGDNRDSAVVEMCKQFAKRGYVVVAPKYRQGWNPQGSTMDIRRGTIMQATYRGIQDAKAAIRYMRKYATEFKVDTGRIVLGGQGTGCYISLAAATLDRINETRYPKFINTTTSQPYIDTAVLGDIDGILPAAINNPNNVGYSSKFHAEFSLGGAMGDIDWMETGEMPMIGFHVSTDPFAPDTSGMTIVPVLNLPIIPVDGNRNIIRKANQLGNNNVFKNAGYNDPYTLAANINNEGWEGYYRFHVAPGGPQSAPWDWWDSATVVAVGAPTLMAFNPSLTLPQAQAAAAGYHANSLLTNQMMSRTKAIAYIDTVQNYLAPRLMTALKLPGSGQWLGAPISNFAGGVNLFPNPAGNQFNIYADAGINEIEIFDLTGRSVYSSTFAVATESINLSREGLKNGVYFVKVGTTSGQTTLKLILN